ncbi:MAG: protein kinase [Gemmatimonadota bacterium]
MPLDAVQWEFVKTTFADLVELEGRERERLLAHLASTDALVHAELMELLAASESVGERFEQGAATVRNLETPGLSGQTIGHWQIVREIGHGGMGTVYEAHRVDDQYTKRVAIKTIAAGRDSEGLLRRFRHERQILARLEHMNIATLLDGGVTPEGHPYFVMEYVEGIPIDQWCRAHHSSLRERIQIFRQVTAAVQYAHEQLVIHRDLKPRNILVTPDGTVKLLDFGIAKLLDPTNSESAELTQTGALPMTAVYASPEQRLGQPVATATDVYSLGVVLYEVLAGARPFGDTAPDIATLERMPIPPSRAVRQAPEGTGETRRFGRQLSGEVDSIVLKALRPEPDKRYRSAQLLGDDLGRYLDGRPVSARSEALSYRVAKFIRRNQAAVLAGSLAIVALVGGTIVSLRQASLARLERDHALREAQRTSQVTAFFQHVLASAKPQREGRAVTIVEAIDSSIQRIDSSFSGDPDLRAAIKLTLGSTLNDMFLYERAQPLLEDAYRIRRSIDRDAPSKDQADALYDLANIEAQIGDAAKAESLYRVSLDMLGHLPNPDSADLYEGFSNVAEAQLNQGKFAQAAALYDTVALALDRLKPADIELRGITRANRGTALAQLGHSAEAEPVLREAVRLFEQARGPDDPRVGSALQPLAGTLILNGKFAEAESVARRALEIDRRELGATNPATLSVMRMLTSAMVEMRRCREAQPMIDWMIGLRGHELVESDPTLGVVLLQRGRCELAQNQLRLAESTFRDALRVRIASFGPTHWAVAQAQSALGEVLDRLKMDREAEQMLRDGYEGMLRELGPDQARTREARDRLKSFYNARGIVSEL